MHNQNKEGVDMDSIKNLPRPDLRHHEAYRRGYSAAISDVLNLARRAEPSVAAGDEQIARVALLKLCDQLDSMKRTMFLRPGTGQHYSYVVHEDMEAYVEQARAALASKYDVGVVLSPAVSQKAATRAAAAQTNPSTAVLHDGVWYVPYVTPSTQPAVSQKDGAAEQPSHETILQEGSKLVCTSCGTTAATTASASEPKCVYCVIPGVVYTDENVATPCPYCRAQAPSRETAPKIKTWRERYAEDGSRASEPAFKWHYMEAEISDLRAALANSGASHAANAGGDVRPGMEFAAKFIEKRAEDYAHENTSMEPDTGATVWHYGDAGRDYHSTLTELADDLRAAIASSAEQEKKHVE